MAYHMVDADPSAEFRSDNAAAVVAATNTTPLSLRRENTAEWHNNEAALGTLTVFIQVVAITGTADFVLEAVTSAGADPVQIAAAPTVASVGRIVLRVDQSVIDSLASTLTHVRVKATPDTSVKFGAWMVGGDQPVAKANVTLA